MAQKLLGLITVSTFLHAHVTQHSVPDAAMKGEYLRVLMEKIRYGEHYTKPSVPANQLSCALSSLRAKHCDQS